MTDEERQIELATLPDEIDVTTFARLAGCSRTHVSVMIRKGVLQARKLKPSKENSAYRIPTSALREHLGIEDADDVIGAGEKMPTERSSVTIGGFTIVAANWSPEECKQRMDHALKLIVELAIEQVRADAAHERGE